MLLQWKRPGATAIDALSRRRRIGILLICSMSLLIVGLDVTIVNVALPSIGRDFDAPLSGLQWTVDAYTLVLASLLMLSGSTADRLGRRRTFVIGLLTFAAGSLLCSLAPSLDHAAHLPHGPGRGRIDDESRGHVDHHQHLHRSRASGRRPSGSGAPWSACRMALGPVVGGLLVTSVGWRSIFWINIPVGLVAIVLALRYIPESKAPVARKVDVPGQALVIVVLSVAHLRHHRGARRGWSSPSSSPSSWSPAASLAALVVWERRASEPLIDLRFFRSVPFSAATRHRRGRLRCSRRVPLPQHALPPGRARPLPAAGRHRHAADGGDDHAPPAVLGTDRGPTRGQDPAGRRRLRSPRLPHAGRVERHHPVHVAVHGLCVFGIGFGFVNAPITNAAVSGMPRAQAGVAAAIASTSRQIGQTLGVAVVGSLVSTSLQRDGPPRLRRWRVGPAGGSWPDAERSCWSSDWWRRPGGPGPRRRRTAESINPEFLEGAAPA